MNFGIYAIKLMILQLKVVRKIIFLYFFIVKLSYISFKYF